MIYVSLIYSRATSYLNCFNVYIFAPYAFYLVKLSYMMDRFLHKAAFGRGRRATYLRADACKRKCSKAEDAKYS